MEQIGQKVSIEGKHTQLQAADHPIQHTDTQKPGGIYNFNSSKPKNQSGTVMLVQMKSNPTLSDQNKALQY